MIFVCHLSFCTDSEIRDKGLWAKKMPQLQTLWWPMSSRTKDKDLVSTLYLAHLRILHLVGNGEKAKGLERRATKIAQCLNKPGWTVEVVARPAQSFPWQTSTVTIRANVLVITY